MKGAIYILIFGVVVAGFIIFLSRGTGQTASNEPQANNVTIVDGKQIIEIKARGGYNPKLSVAKAGIPTIVRFTTNGSFDCSASVRIPSLNVSKLLPQTGTTDIEVGTPQAGPLLGTCGMGMYRFEIDFQA